MNDTITINLRALTEDQRWAIECILQDQIELFDDEVNREAYEIIKNFEE